MERLVDKFNKEREESRNGGWQTKLEYLMREIFVHRGREVCVFNFDTHFREIQHSLTENVYIPFNLHEQVIKFIKENGFVVSRQTLYEHKDVASYLVCLS